MKIGTGLPDTVPGTEGGDMREGCDEFVLFPTPSDPAEVGRLGEAVL